MKELSHINDTVSTMCNAHSLLELTALVSKLTKQIWTYCSGERSDDHPDNVHVRTVLIEFSNEMSRIIEGGIPNQDGGVFQQVKARAVKHVWFDEFDKFHMEDDEDDSVAHCDRRTRGSDSPDDSCHSSGGGE